MPDALVNIVGARTIAELCGIATYNGVPFLGLECQHSSREEASCHKIQEAG